MSLTAVRTAIFAFGGHCIALLAMLASTLLDLHKTPRLVALVNALLGTV